MSTVYRFMDKNGTRAYDIHSDGRKFGFFKNFKFDFAVVENAAETQTVLIGPGDNDYDVILGNADEIGDIKIMGTMTDEQLGLWNVGAFFELFMWPNIESIHSAAVARSATRDEKIIVVACCIETFGVDSILATQEATDFIDNNIKPSFRDLGMTDAPDSYKKILES